MNDTKRLPRVFFGIETFPIDQNNNIALFIFCGLHQSIHPTFTLSIRLLKNMFDFGRDVQIRVSIKTETETCDMGGVHFARNNVLHRVHVRMISSYHTPRTSPCGHQLRSHTLPTNTSVQDEITNSRRGNTALPCAILRLVSRDTATAACTFLEKTFLLINNLTNFRTQRISIHDVHVLFSSRHCGQR